MKVRCGLAVALALTGAALAGCGGETQKQQAGGPQTLRIAGGAEPSTLDLLANTDTQTQMFGYNVYQSLTRLDASGGVQPLLATSWKQDGKAWDFTLRSGVKFSDGTPLTSADVVASWTKGIAAGINSVLTQVESVTAVDDRTVKITSKQVDPELPGSASGVIVAPAAWAAKGDKRMADQMLGTGPYRLVRWSRGDRVALARNDDYWGTAPRYKTVEVLFRSEESVRVAALRAGEVDIAYLISPNGAASLPNTISAPLAQVLGARLKFRPGSPLADPRLRQAVNLAIDRPAILKTIYGGKALPANGQQVTKAAQGFNPDITDYPYDPAQAKQLVSEAGKTGLQLTMTTAVGKWEKSREVAQAIDGMLTAAGFKMKTSYDDVKQWYDKIFAKQRDLPDLTLLVNTTELLSSKQTLGNYSCEGSYPGGCDEAFTKLADEAAAAPSLDARRPLYQAGWKQAHDDNILAPIAALGQLHGVRAGLQWKPYPLGWMFFDDVKLTAH